MSPPPDNSSSAGLAASAAPPVAKKIISCSSCRSRKTKCDKVQPACGPCCRSGLDCFYPARRAKNRARTRPNNDVAERIQRIEKILGSAELQALGLQQRATSSSSSGTAATKAAAGQGEAETGFGSLRLEETVLSAAEAGSRPAASEERQSSGAGIPWEARQDTTQQGRQSLSPAATTSSGSGAGGGKYSSTDFWGVLSAEVAGIKQALEEPSSSDDEDEGAAKGSSKASSSSAANRSSSAVSSPFMFGASDAETPSLPNHQEIVSLWHVYILNVDPVFKILHRPSMSEVISEVGHSQARGLRPSPETTALISCICYTAAVSLPEEERIQYLGHAPEEVLRRYRREAEKALAAANYLDSDELVVLQAFAMYIAALRSHDHSRSSWVLTATLVRIASALGLNNDGDGSQFPPFQAEMRRRLWYSIITLDVRASEDRGTPALNSALFNNTAMPTPIDDEAFHPGQPELLVPKTGGVPENIFGLCTARCAGIFGLLIHQSQVSPGGRKESRTQSEDDLVYEIRRLEQDFIHTADPSSLQSMYAAEVARGVILKIWLTANYPHRASPNIALPRVRVSRETTLRSALTLVESLERFSQPPYSTRFLWWHATFSQWHSLAVALAELCVQTEGELVEYAWVVVDRSLPFWRDNIADEAGGTMWRPIRKLLKKAREARAAAVRKGTKNSGGGLKLEQVALPHLDHLPSATTSPARAAESPVGQFTQAPMPSVESSFGPTVNNGLAQMETPAPNFNFFTSDLAHLFDPSGQLYDGGGGMDVSMADELDPWQAFLDDAMTGPPENVDTSIDDFMGSI